VVIETEEGDRYALTPTCAANALGMIPNDAFARGNRAAAQAAFRPLAVVLGLSVEAAAQRVLDVSCRKVSNQVEELIAEYQLDRATVELIGGGGGAASLVPRAATLCGLPSRLARKAEVISTIGVALAMVRDTVERNIVDPSPDDILQVRREAAEAVIKAGALPETIEVQVEVDTRRNLVKATAFGTTELRKRAGDSGSLDREGCQALAARSMHVVTEQVRLAGESSGLYVFVASREERSLFGLIKSQRHMLRVTDRSGVVRLQRADGEVVASTVQHIARDLEHLLTRLTDFGDAGRALPDAHVLVGARLINLSGLADIEQAIKLAGAELEALPPEEPLVIVATRKSA
jgi:hypothetical protein